MSFLVLVVSDLDAVWGFRSLGVLVLLSDLLLTSLVVLAFVFAMLCFLRVRVVVLLRFAWWFGGGLLWLGCWVFRFDVCICFAFGGLLFGFCCLS